MILGFNPEVQKFPRTNPQIPAQHLAKIPLLFPISSFPSFFMAKSGGKGGEKNKKTLPVYYPRLRL